MRSGMKREVKKSYSWKSKIEKDKLSSRQTFFGMSSKKLRRRRVKVRVNGPPQLLVRMDVFCLYCIYACVCVCVCVALSTAASCGWCRQRPAGGSWWCGVEAPESFCSFYHTGTWRASERGSECGGRSWRGTWYHSHSAETRGSLFRIVNNWLHSRKNTTTRCCI